MLRTAAGAGALHPCRRLGLLRPQRRRRRGRGCGAARPRAARAAGARAMDARAGARLGAVRSGDADRGEGRARRRRQHRRLGVRRVEQYAQHAAGHRRQPACRHGIWPRRSRRPRRSRFRCPRAAATATRIPLYVLPNARVVHHFIPAMPVRVSALRALGAYMNVFSIESFIDELARAAGADPVEFRLRHLDDPRARDVITDRGDALRLGGPATRAAVAARASPSRATRIWAPTWRSRSRSRSSARAAAPGSCAPSPRSTAGRRSIPDGIRNQIEGGIVQATSWTLHEAVSFDATRITSADWSSYPILRFPEVPDKRRSACHRPARAAVSRHRRGGAGADRGGARQRAGAMPPARACASCRSPRSASRRRIGV